MQGKTFDVRVKAFLETQKKEAEVKARLEKEKTLIELGLYEKVYSQSAGYSDEFTCMDSSGENAYKPYKKVAISVTDEEYEEIKKYSNAKSRNKNSDNTNDIAEVLVVIAYIIFVGGFIVGCVLGSSDHDFSFPVALTCWFSSFVSGMLFIGFAEVIKLLNEIKNK